MPSYAASSNFLGELKNVVDHMGGGNAVGLVRKIGIVAILFDRAVLPCGAQSAR
jgi:hypothetical protein